MLSLTAEPPLFASVATMEVLAAIGSGPLAHQLVASFLGQGFKFQFFDILETSTGSLQHSGLVKCESPLQAAQGAKVVFLVIHDYEQLETVLFGEKGVISAIPPSTPIMLCGALLPTYIHKLAARLSGEQKGLMLLDAFVFLDSNSTMKLVVSGSDDAVEKASQILSEQNILQIKGDISAASKVRLVDNMLAGVQIAAAAEAMVLGAAAGIDVRDLYDIIRNAAGCSRMFVKRVPRMLDDDMVENDGCVNYLMDILGLILEEAKGLAFPLPLTALAQQQFLLASASGYGEFSDAALVKIWEKTAGITVHTSAKDDQSSLRRKAAEVIKGAARVQDVGFIGLGAMGFGMAATLLRKNFNVCGFDVFEPTVEKFKNVGGTPANSAAGAAKGAEVLVLMVATEAQAEACLYGDCGAVSALSHGCTIVLSSTVSPKYVKDLERRLHDEGRDLHLVDAPVSGGVKRAADGTLTIMAAGSAEALKRAGIVLSAMSETLYVIDGGAGAGSGVKVVNQLLAGVHIAAAAEAMAFGARLGINTRNLYQIIGDSDGSSWIFLNRVPHMLDADFTPLSAVNIFVKDLGIVLGEGKRLGIPLHIAAASHQQFLLAAASGWGREDDSAVVKIFEKLAGITVASKDIQGTPGLVEVSEVPVLSRSEVLNSLIPEWPEDPTDEIQRSEDDGLAKILVVLDDDPTGTQTVHGVTVLTEWGIEAIKEEFLNRPKCFFILTNSRALSREKAFSLIKEISTNVKAAAALTNSLYTIVLRGDSTLRGHFPEEPDAVTTVIGQTDAWIICPFFPQGGRYTINDVHYVAEEDKLVPAGKTEFAKDAVFGYQSSNLKEWVEEKTKGRVKSANVATVSIETLRKGGPKVVCEHLCGLPNGSVCIVNAASERDMAVFAAGMIQAEIKGKKFLCRTAATFVSARIGLKYKDPISPKELGVCRDPNGGLVIVGSYVPKTTKQVEALKLSCSNLIHCLTVEVRTLVFGSEALRQAEINQAVTAANALLAAGKDTVIMTSRDLITGKDDTENLEINSKVSTALVEITKRVKVRPRYLLAKGGITSSDLATKAMEAHRAEVVGQALPGVPIWKLAEGSKHPGLPYIVFPGNVGGPSALAEIVKNWAAVAHQSAKDMLLAAEKGAYAIGAFNVYNLEAISAVVAAAEAGKSPAILQIHPSALKHGKLPLVACCIAAAKASKIPVAVHLDHGNNEQDVMAALDMGFDSIMIDGSHFSFEKNLELTKRITRAAHARNIMVEAELGRLSGTEDGLTVEEYEERLTDVTQANQFLKETGVDALAVCIGNVHGKYPSTGPKLNLKLLEELQQVVLQHNAVLVLHGASGLPAELVKDCIKFGVRKFNVNTEVRSAYINALKTSKGELLDIITSAEDAMQAVVLDKLKLFGSIGKAPA